MIDTGAAAPWWHARVLQHAQAALLPRPLQVQRLQHIVVDAASSGAGPRLDTLGISTAAAVSTALFHAKVAVLNRRLQARTGMVSEALQAAKGFLLQCFSGGIPSAQLVKESPLPHVICLPEAFHARGSLAAAPAPETGWPAAAVRLAAGRQAVKKVAVAAQVAKSDSHTAVCHLCIPQCAKSHLAVHMLHSHLGLPIAFGGAPAAAAFLILQLCAALRQHMPPDLH